jgi:hypothetical protein
LTSARGNLVQNASSSDGPQSSAPDLALSDRGDRDRYDGCDRHHSAQLTDLVKRGVEPQVGVLTFDGPVAKRLHVLVQGLADAAHLRL